jgi:phospholipid/cholesterol/gamma-HCH transport system permease protein
MLKFFEGLGFLSRRIFCDLGLTCRFFLSIICSSKETWLRLSLFRKELYQSGVLSLLIIVVSGWFVGMVLGLQGYNTLSRFGASDALGALVALSLLRELGPVLSALLFASRAGSSMTAEIALMKTTDQLNALEVMAIDPMARVVAPRFWAGSFALPMLTLIFNTAGLLGAYFVGVVLVGLDDGNFWSQMQSSVVWSDDVLNGMIKSIVFGIAVSWVSVYQGMRAQTTASGIASATTRTVVLSSLVVFALDFLLTAWMF